MPPPPENPPAVSANDDESARIDIAVRALDDMRSRVSVPNPSEGRSGADQQFALLTFGFFRAGRATRSNSRGGEQDESQQKPTRDFVSRVSLFPLVGTALRAYEQGKASSRVVKVYLSFCRGKRHADNDTWSIVWGADGGIWRQNDFETCYRPAPCGPN